MQEHAVLGQVALGYCPMVDRRREVVAMRLSVYPEKPDAAPDADALLAALEQVWPRPEAVPPGTTPRPLNPVTEGARVDPKRKPLALNVAGEAALAALLQARPGGQFLIEVPAFMASDPAQAHAIAALHAAGTVLLIKGRPLKPLAPQVLGCFSHSMIDVADDRRVPGAHDAPPRSVTTVQSGLRTSEDFEHAFERGAVAVLGWNLDDPPPERVAKRSTPSDVGVVMELISGVEREQPVAGLEALLKREPTIAFKLMRYLNSPAFGLNVEINSFGHALMLLGHQRLKRWLALLLASSSKNVAANVTMFAAVRRGLIMEELAKLQQDPEMAGEMFICGVFSLLDRLLEQPLADLLAGMPVPERVRLALLEESGPYVPYLQLVQAMEHEAVFDIREARERLLLHPADVNRALLAALDAARQLD
jgi:EAL and modified HD-GYP domain-containing signal transduction protein